MRTSRQVPKSPSGRRMAIAYTLLAALALAVVLAVLQAGAQRRPARQVPAGQRVAQATLCLGPAGTELRLEQSGRFLTLDGPDRLAGRLRLDGDRLHGQVACRDGGSAALDVVLDGGGLRGTVGGAELATTATAGQVGGGGAAARPAVPRSAEEAFGQLMLAVAVVILAARLVGAAVRRVGQPPVMGEVLAGILLGPTLLGTVAPGVSAFVFPEWVVPYLRAGADIGLAFYMFLVGLELDPALLRGRVQQAALISHASIALPITLGVAVALPLFGLVGPPTSFVPFALFMGVAMSITAFRVLALAALFCAVMLLVVRRLLARVSDAYDEAGHVPGGWIATIFVGVLLSSFVTQRIGIAAIFGAFVMGLAMPAGPTSTRRVEDFVVTVLLPLFFVVTGLRVRVGLLDRQELWLLALVLLAVAIAGKWLVAAGAARFTGFTPRESAAIGALMNTRGLTELIVLSIGLELGVVTPALFTMLVLMALVTTFMAGPLLRLIDPRGTLGVQPEEELAAARPVTPEPARAPDRSVLVAPQDAKSLDWLIALARPLARGRPPRAVVLARLLGPAR